MPSRYLPRIVSSIAIATLWLLLGLPTASAATPEFRLVPDRGTCTTTEQTVVLQAANFAPGPIVILAKVPSGTSHRQTFVFNGGAGEPDRCFLLYLTMEAGPFSPFNSPPSSDRQITIFCRQASGL